MLPCSGSVASLQPPVLMWTSNSVLVDNDLTPLAAICWDGHPPISLRTPPHEVEPVGKHRGSGVSIGRRRALSLEDIWQLEDRLEDLSYFLSYNHPTPVGMAHHEERAATFAMARGKPFRTGRSDLHHLRGHQ